ncbi:hypothetical protein [Bordetella pertussis]|uniref:hypothetical protein n=1 Tax=Bordetella pertussis TaxID=520 RepID=UPI000A97E04A|nr:hypothetical protein [Bordetella pertussis]
MNWGGGDFQFLKSGSDEPCIQPIESSHLAAPLPDPLTWTWRARAARPAIMTAARRLRPAFAQDAP